MDFKDIQDAELEAVRAIFMDDFQDKETHTVWKSVNAVHEFTIRVHPMEDELKSAVNLVLHFKLPKTYPKLAPQLSIDKSQGLSPAHIQGIKDLLKTTAKSLLGSEMIYELVTAVSTFLTENNAVFVRFGKHTSLKEDKAKREEEREQALIDQALLDEEEQKKQQLAENERLQAEMEADEQHRQVLRESRMRADRATVGTTDTAEGSGLAVVERFEKTLQLPGNIPADLVVQGSIIGNDTIGSLYHAEAVAESRRGVRLPCTLQVIDLYAPYFSTTSGLRKLEAIEEELADLCELRHPNVLAVYGCRKRKIEDTVSHGWRVCIVTEPLPRSTLYELVEDVGELKLQRALPYFRSIAAALQQLHTAEVVHRNVCLKHVHIGRSGVGEPLVKLSSALWLQAFLDIHRSNRFLDTEPHAVPSAWKWPNLLSNPLAIDKRQDIWDFGVLMLQAIHGIDAVTRFPSPAHVLAENAGSAFNRLIVQVFDSNSISAARLVEKLLDLEVDSTNSTNGHSNSFSSAKIPKSPTELLPQFSMTHAFSPPQQSFLQEQAGLFFQPKAVASASRYRSEFEEVEKLGQGGFGQVVKARNKLDNNFYAIKKVKLPSDPSLEQKILREVTIWGRLSHPGIVRYHTSWVETENSSTDVRQALDMLTSSGTGSIKDSDDTDTESDIASEDSGSESVGANGATEEDFDLGFDDLDFISKGHQSKSLSMPTIHFGNEDDPTPEMSRVATRHATPDIASPPELALRQSRTLYIQMEFVSGQTLREQIDDGITEEEMWRILRQLLNAMRYYTSFNIIHRDMKPSNILLDNAGSVRIADFGLAVEQNASDDIGNMSASATKGDSDLTSGVGTSLYLAPETIERKRPADRANKYTDKVDMYSLGIIIFEMCWPIQTRMERLDILKAIRRPEIVFPHGWDDSDAHRFHQGKIVRWCLSHDPTKRAGPLDLLRSDLLPAAVQDDYITDTLALLAQPNTPHLQTVLTALFQARPEDKRAQDLAFDVDLEDTELNNPYDRIVKQKLESIFAVRGAVDFSPPLLMPASDLYDEKSRRPVRLLNRQGASVQLPYDLVLPLARFVARDDSITRLKRWNISPVYREDRMGGQPRAFLAASYDVISQFRTIAAEAECIHAIDEVLTEVTVEEDFVHVIGHFDLLAVILDTLPQSKQVMARRVLERYELLSSPWSQVVGEMAKLGLGRKGLDDLATLDICDEMFEVESRLSTLAFAASAKAKRALQEISQLVTMLKGLGIERRILVSPLLCFKHELHVGGICFQTRQQRVKRRDVFAEGGRYDKLVESLAMPGTRQIERCLVGVTLAVSKLSRSLAARASPTPSKARASVNNDKTPRRCEVYIVSYSPGLIEARLLVAKELWKQRVSADLMYDDDFAKLGPDRIAATARKEGIRYLAIVKASNAARDTILKVKDLSTNHEREVYRQDLASYLHEKLGDNAANFPTDVPTTSGNRSLPSSDNLDGHLSMPADILKKMKHKQKQIILDKAAESVTQALTSAGDIPLFAVDAEGEVFRLMSESTTWICRDDSGQAIRRILEAAPASRKAYILELQDELRAFHAKTVCRFLWLYSLKDTKANLLSFL